MWAAILGIFPTLAGWINLIVQWFQARAVAQNDQNTAVGNAASAHQDDGAQSVVDQVSSDAQIAAIKNQINQLDNPTPVVIVKPGGSQ